MPFACALYPLGDFLSSPRQVFYSLDARGCEGVHGEGGTRPGSRLGSPLLPSTIPVVEYARSHAFRERREASEWFRSLATAWATSGAEDALSAAAAAARAPLPPFVNAPHAAPGEAVFALRRRLRLLWYSEAPPGNEPQTPAPGPAAASWPEERSRIERVTRALLDEVAAAAAAAAAHR